MRRGEFEEIIEECLSALLEGRRSVEESLFLYPAWRGRLEPLLRAAEEIAAGLDQVPPPFARERGLQRFLGAARARRRLRQTMPPRAPGTLWWRWAPTGLAAVIVIGTLALMSATLMAEDGRRLGDRASVVPYTPTAERTAPPVAVQTPLERVQESVAILEDAVRQEEPVSVGFLQELEDASSDLAAELDRPGEMGLIDRVAAVSVTSREYELLQRLQQRSSGMDARAVEGSLAAAAEVLDKLGATPTPELIPTPSPEPTASPAASPSPGSSPTPVEDGTEAPSPTGTE